MSKEAEEYFKEEWGTGFTRATLHEKRGLLELSMNDIYETMDKFAESFADKQVKKALEEVEKSMDVTLIETEDERDIYFNKGAKALKGRVNYAINKLKKQ